MRKINFYSQEHLGDNIYHFHYCRKLLNNNNDIEIDYYIKKPIDCNNFEKFYNELHKHIFDLKRFNLIRNFKSVPKDTLNIHINNVQTGRKYFEFINYPKLDGNLSYNEFYIYFFEHISKILNVDNPIKTNDDFLIDNPLILNDNLLYNNDFDFLVINSKALSGQIDNNLKLFDPLFEYLLSKGYKVISTEKTRYNEILSTVEYGLSLVEIGNLSLKCKNIVGVHTAPIIYTFNKWNIDKIKQWILFQSNGVHYTFKDRVMTFKSLNDMNKVIKIL